MDQSFINALILLALSCFICWRVYAKNCRQTVDANKEPNGIDEAEIKTTYRRKTLFRLSVFGLCGAAFAAYWFEVSRFVILGLLILAGYCQYRVWQEKTGHFFNDALNSMSQQMDNGSKKDLLAKNNSK